MRRIAVVGAGVVGLSTALSLQKSFPLSKITIFADKFKEETLSDGAGGLFRPEINLHPDSDRVRKWCQDSLSHFLEIIRSPEASCAGMQLVSGYHLSSSPVQLENNLLQELVPECRILNKKELKMFPEQFKNGLFFTTVITDCRYYMSWMQSKFEKSGGSIVKKCISSFDEIPDDFSIIVNCTGLGAKKLLHDKMMIPIRGQTIRVKAPWIKNFYYGDDAYIVPGVDYVTLGGIKDYGSSNLAVNPYQKKYIWDKCAELVPSLKNVEVLRDWVGLRPFRNSVRVDASFVNCKSKHRLVVNNYGHGGHGVTLSWGTAQEVVKLVQSLEGEKEFVVSRL